MTYGVAPEVVGTYDLDWEEYMHYMYLPVAMDKGGGVRLPHQLRFLSDVIEETMVREGMEYILQGFSPYYKQTPFKYVYVTARRGYATPGNPLNRPGWHADGFGTNDVNYIWADKFSTRFLVDKLSPEISEDHIESGRQFEEWAENPRIFVTYPDKTLLRLDPYVVHAAPEIPAPGGERSFLKISFSNEQYNLKGNSHNYLFDYDWKMWDRDVLRNDPAYAGKDVGPQ